MSKQVFCYGKLMDNDDLSCFISLLVFLQHTGLQEESEASQCKYDTHWVSNGSAELEAFWSHKNILNFLKFSH